MLLVAGQIGLILFLPEPVYVQYRYVWQLISYTYFLSNGHGLEILNWSSSDLMLGAIDWERRGYTTYTYNWVDSSWWPEQLTKQG